MKWQCDLFKMKSNIKFLSSGDPAELIIYRLCLCSFFPQQALHAHPHIHCSQCSTWLIFLILCLPQSCRSCSSHYCHPGIWHHFLCEADTVQGSSVSPDAHRMIARHCVILIQVPSFAQSTATRFICGGSRQGGDTTANIANGARCSAITLIRCGTSCLVWKPLTISDLH